MVAPTLKTKYENDIRPALSEQHGYTNRFQVPKLEKIVVNIGIDTQVDRDMFQKAVEELGRITGQRPQVTKARKSVSNFRLREGMDVGARVTLRGKRMYEFLDRLINVALPRIRDFRGVPDQSFDGRGNYNLGLREQTIFPEINPDHVKRNQGMDVSIVTTAATDEEARDLLRQFGMPFTTS